MRKIRTIIMLLLFTVWTAGHAGLYRSQTTEDSNATDPSGVQYGSFSSSAQGDYGLFRSSSATNPGDRPGHGGAIGQSPPIGDGLSVLFVCCLLLVIVKVYLYHGSRKSR